MHFYTARKNTTLFQRKDFLLMPTVKASSETKSQPKVVPKLVFTMEQSLKFQLQTAPTVPNESDI